MKPLLSIIIPAYNEAERLPSTLENIQDYLSKVDYETEIIVVDDYSSDGTTDIVRKFARTMHNLRLIEDGGRNRGKGWAVRRGMLCAHGKLRLFMDADNATSIDQIENIFPFFEKGYDIVIGSRAIKGTTLNPPQPWHKRVLGKLGNVFIQILLLPGIKDTQCGFKCFSKKAAERIFRDAQSDGWEFDVEILALAKKYRFNIKEIPVVWRNHPQSRVRWGDYFKTLSEVVKIHRRLRR